MGGRAAGAPAERQLEVEQEKQAERDRYAKMTPREVAWEVADRQLQR
jgi:hypothetical protein